MPTWLFLILLGVLGLVFGSFGNVVIWRLPRGESVSHPPSACPECRSPIRLYDNVPVVSWLVLRGQCRACGERISLRYPLVEALSGILWVVAGLAWGQTPACVSAIVLFYTLLLLSFIDFDTMRLPNVLVLPLGAFGFLAAAIAQFSAIELAPITPTTSGWLSQPLVAAVVGSLAGSGFALALALGYSLLRRAEGFGMGDVKLLWAMGPFLGMYTLLVLFLGSLLGAVYGIFQAAGDGGSMRMKIPFGPFLAMAAVIVSLGGPAAWNWYISLVTGV